MNSIPNGAAGLVTAAECGSFYPFDTLLHYVLQLLKTRLPV